MAYAENVARELVIQAGHRLLEAGLIARTWGNVSARISDTQFVITPSGRSYENLKPEDLVVVSILDCSYSGEIKPSSEKGIHADVYKMRPSVDFVIHTHQTKASVFGVAGRTLTGLEETFPGGFVPCAAYGMPSTGTLRRAVREALSDYEEARAVLMRYHGALCLGEDYEDAFGVAEALEKVCSERIELLGNGTEKSAAGEKAEDSLPDYGRSVRKGKKFKLQWNGKRCVYDLQRLPGELPAAAKIHAAIYKNSGATYIFHEKDGYVKAVSERGQTLHPCLDDLAQIAGTSIRCVPEGAAASDMAKALKGRNAVLIQGVGALCTGRTRDDVTAVRMILKKGCEADLFAAAFPDCRPLKRLDAFLQRVIYVKKYSKKKEEQTECSKN